MLSCNRRLRAAALASAISLALAGCSRSEKRSEPPPLTVTVVNVGERTVAGSMTASGRLLPREEIAVAADLNGYRIADVLVEEGAHVRRGQVLAVLDPSLLRGQLAQVRASLAQQQANAEQAREQAARVNGLDGVGVLSDEAIRNRQLASRAAQAAAAATAAQLQDLQTRNSHLLVRAPSDGLVLERTARPGDTSSSSATLFRLARGGQIELFAELPEADAANIAPGDPAAVMLASGTRLTGNVRLLGSRVDSRTGLVTVRVALPGTGELRQGGFAKATFTRAATVTAVPEGAVFYDADGASVKVVDGSNRIHTVHVRTGRHAQNMVELVEGPPSGTRVAVKGAAFTLDGDVVRIAADKER
ncbi:MAG: efflux RND transporter periplasmic adaptor subunit [Sphingomonadales bacterium]|nr:efflux RND transporter periplasmic adaptor subunit [Sphingomonadales bacterium]